MSPRRRAVALLVVAALGTAAGQFARCRPDRIIQPDGSFSFGGCREATVFGRRIGDEGIARLVKAIPPSLKLLDIWSSGIGPLGAVALGKMLETNTGLEKLYMNENEIGPAGAKALAAGLAKNRGLNTLWLSSCGVGDEGATALAGALSKTQAQTLEVLDLWNNSIGPTGAAAIATALESNHRLRTLEMRLNRVGDAGAASFAALMPKNVPLSTLDLISNGISDTGRQALREGLKVARANPYLVLFEDGFPQQQTTSWEAKGQQNAP